MVLADLVHAQCQIPQMPETGFIVGNRPAERAERCCQDLNTIEIGARVIEYTMQVAP